MNSTILYCLVSPRENEASQPRISADGQTPAIHRSLDMMHNAAIQVLNDWAWQANDALGNHINL